MKATPKYNSHKCTTLNENSQLVNVENVKILAGRQAGRLNFIDLYAGIGGIRLGFQNVFGKKANFVFSSEIDQNACRTYDENFGEHPHGDIRKIKANNIPQFDVLLGGFPCQAFSIAGHKLGFDDARGTHFFEIARILKKCKPRAFLLENVRHFISHNNGHTFQTIKHIIEDDLQYTFYYKLLNAKDFGLPQNRERLYMVGFREPTKFSFPKPTFQKTKLKDILENKITPEYFISQRYWNTLKKHRRRHESKGNGFGYVILDKNGISNTIVLGGMGRERNLIVDNNNWKKCKSKRSDINDGAIRVLTPRECLRLQGFPDNFKTPVAKTHLWRQAANSVAINVIEKIAECMKKSIERHDVAQKRRGNAN